MKSHFKFNGRERSGIFFLLLLIVIAQGIYFYLRSIPPSKGSSFFVNEAKQHQIDSLKNIYSESSAFRRFPFNPNFISDHKGYALGMSIAEIDRLSQFRTSGQFVNSVKEFQKVTQVSDSLLDHIAPYFKFPDWVSQKHEEKSKKNTIVSSHRKASITDLNEATAAELRKITGIGEKLSARIIKFRTRLGGFLVNEQLYDVYGLKPEVVKRALKRFQVLHAPSPEKININSADAEEIASLVYIGYDLANNIVSYRNAHGPYKTLDELFNVQGFPVNKVERIALYLQL